MKKLFFASAFALFGAMNAQDSGFEGRTFITGSVGFSNQTKTEENAFGIGTYKENTFSIAPTVGHFVSPTVALGLGLGYANTKIEGDSETANAFSVTPLVRKYWGVGNNLYIFGQAALPLGWVKAGESKISTIGFQVAPGLDYFITNNWSIEATLGSFGFASAKPKGGKAVTNSEFGIKLNNINFGVKYIF